MVEDIVNEKILDFNSQTPQIMGYTKEEFKNFSAIGMMPELQADGRPTFVHYEQQLQDMNEKGVCFVEDWLMVHKDGHLIWTDVALAKFYEDRDDIIIVQFRDVSQRHQAQQAIKQSEQRFHSLFEHSADAVSIIDSNTYNFIDTNKKSLEIFGYSKEELMSKTPVELSAAIQADGRSASEHMRELIVTVKKDGYYFIDNWINKRADGTEFYSELSITNFSAPNEHIFIIQRRDITEKLQAQQALQQQKDYLRTIIDYIPLIVTVKDTEGNYILTNQIAAKTFGMSVEDVIGRNDEEFKSRKGWRRVLDSDKKVVETGEILHINDIVAKDPNGEIRYGQATKVPIKNENGEVTQILTVVNDITEIKIAEKLLQKQKDYLRMIIDLSPNFIFSKDINGVFVLANKSLSTAYGTTPDDLEGKTDADFNPNKEEVAFFLQKDRKTMINGEIVHIPQETISNATGETKILRTIKVPIFDENGNCEQMLGVAVDITEYKQIERDLRESETKFRAIFENSHAILTILDIEGNILNQNRLLLKDSELNIGRPAWESRWFAHDENLIAQVKKDLKKIAKGKAVTRQFTYEKTPNNMGHIICTTKPIYTENGKDILFLLAESREITDLMQSQQALADKVDELNTKNEELKKYIDSNMQLENFAYITSHDLREPLRTISGFANLLEKKYIGKLDETADEYLGYILTSTKNMNALIEDLLIFSRVHTGEHTVEKLDLDDLLFEIIRSLNSSIEDTGALVTYENIPETINANRTKMKQLFQNLIANAIKFRKPNVVPEVKITAKSKGKYWEFSVQDNGIGIKDEYFDKIFMIFKRLHTKEEYQGTGIGLSLCKKIVEQHGGKISLKSKKGEGTTFYFTIEK